MHYCLITLRPYFPEQKSKHGLIFGPCFWVPYGSNPGLDMAGTRLYWHKLLCQRYYQPRLLREARAACDRLIVALNTDSSVKRLKGPNRPLQTETARAIVMASMAPVDLVTLFDEDTPLEMIRALKPDVLVKGSDYTVDQVVGADLVQSWDGRVVLVTLEDGHSTTGTIRRMALPEA